MRSDANEPSEITSSLCDSETEGSADLEIVENDEEWPKKGTIDYRDCVYLTETLAVNPFCAEKGKTEEKWKEVADLVAAYGPKMKFAWKSIRDRVNALLKEHLQNIAKSAAASGVCESYSKKVKLLDEIADLKEAGSGEKDLQKEAKEKLDQLGKDKREQAMENRRKKNSASGNEGEEEEPKKIKRKHMPDVMDSYFKSKVENEKWKMEEDSKFKMLELQLKERELALRERELQSRLQ
jgi:hypothetical protein